MKNLLSILLLPLLMPWSANAESGQTSASFTCGNGLPPVTITYGPTVPQNQNIPNQSIAGCYAWSEFISLNWPQSGNDFGAVGDVSPIQWQTYMRSELLFNSQGAAPPPWGTQISLSAQCAKEAGVTSGEQVTYFSGYDQAAPGDGKPSWLAPQTGGVVWYEMRVNQDEYNYVNQNSLYSMDGQDAYVNGGKGSPVLMPKGDSNGTVGAIELKAAWIEAAGISSDKLKRFKTTTGVLQDPVTGTCRKSTMALVGMHILHKIQSQPTWVWATFEQVDNAPSTAASSGNYTFYNANCSSQNIPAACSTSGTIPCTPNTAPTYPLGKNCGPLPIQIVRSTSIDSTTASVNSTVTSNIASSYQDSVWQYYQLVDVLWSTNPAPEPTKPTPAPRTVQSMTSGNAGLVANTTMESYAQTTTCTKCHVYGSIASGTYSSDFSFLFDKAGVSSAGQVKYHEGFLKQLKEINLHQDQP